MPKKPPRDNPRNRNSRTIQGAAEGVANLLRRMSRRSDVILSTADGSDTRASHIARSANPAVCAAVSGSIRDIVRGALPEELRPHVLDCLMRPAELVLFTDTAAWATRLRMAACEAAANGALSTLPAGVTGATKITVRVAAASGR